MGTGSGLFLQGHSSAAFRILGTSCWPWTCENPEWDEGQAKQPPSHRDPPALLRFSSYQLHIPSGLAPGSLL